jgi:DNA-binding transcriptional regulator YiaG
MTGSDLALLVEAREAASSGRGVDIRCQAGLSQGELARAAGVNTAAVSRWEGRARKPSGRAALKYARVLRVLSNTATIGERGVVGD